MVVLKKYANEITTTAKFGIALKVNIPTTDARFDVFFYAKKSIMSGYQTISAKNPRAH